MNQLRNLALSLGGVLSLNACSGHPTKILPREVPFWHSARYQGEKENETKPLVEDDLFPYRSVDFYATMGKDCSLDEKVRIIWCSHLDQGDKAPIWHSYDSYQGYDCKTLNYFEEKRAYGIKTLKKVNEYELEFQLVGDAFNDRIITVYSSPSTNGSFTLDGLPTNDLIEKSGLSKRTDRCNLDAKTDLVVEGQLVLARVEKIVYIKHESGRIPDFPGLYVTGYALEEVGDVTIGDKVQEYIPN